MSTDDVALVNATAWRMWRKAVSRLSVTGEFAVRQHLGIPNYAPVGEWDVESLGMLMEARTLMRETTP